MSEVTESSAKDYKPTFDLKMLTRTVREIALERPTHVYNHGGRGCAYVDLDPDYEPCETGCLIGTALRKLGVPAAYFLETDQNQGTAVRSVLESLFGHDLDIVSGVNRGENAFCMTWLAKVQQLQDHKTAWGECVRMADDQVFRYATGVWNWNT